jgi:hypothetical protein
VRGVAFRRRRADERRGVGEGGRHADRRDQRRLDDVGGRPGRLGAWSAAPAARRPLRADERPPAARIIARFLGLHRTERLSPAALETLAIVAYRGPVTRGEIEAIRGVDSSGVVQTLLARELIEALGRRSSVGQPVEYAVTANFLRHFGLASLAELPPLGEVNGRSVEETWG